MDKKLLISIALSLVMGAAIATWAVWGYAGKTHAAELADYKEKSTKEITTLKDQLASYCSGQSIGPGVRATHVRCGDKDEVCICGVPRR